MSMYFFSLKCFLIVVTLQWLSLCTFKVNSIVKTISKYFCLFVFGDNAEWHLRGALWDRKKKSQIFINTYSKCSFGKFLSTYWVLFFSISELCECSSFVLVMTNYKMAYESKGISPQTFLTQQSLWNQKFYGDKICLAVIPVRICFNLQFVFLWKNILVSHNIGLYIKHMA